MKNDLYEVHDDWLEKERRREERLSVWSLFDNRLINYQEHQENCERAAVEQEHKEVHRDIIAESLKQNSFSRRERKKRKSKEASVISVIAEIIVIIFFILMAII